MPTAIGTVLASARGAEWVMPHLHHGVRAIASEQGNHASPSIVQQPRQSCLAFEEREIAQILAIMLDKIEGVDDQLFVRGLFWIVIEMTGQQDGQCRLAVGKWSLALMPTATVLILALWIEMTLPVFMSLLP
jgi:hypothetical protein